MEKTNSCNSLTNLENKLSEIFSSVSSFVQKAIYISKPITIILLFRFLILDSQTGKANNGDEISAILTYVGYFIQSSTDCYSLIIILLYVLIVIAFVKVIKHNKKHIGLLVIFIISLLFILFLAKDLNITVSGIENACTQKSYIFLANIAVCATFLYLSFSSVIELVNFIEENISPKETKNLTSDTL
ncbi:hypothetical protein B0187_09460 [Haemophilus paracuniculus]|uniref:Uncharacterized protein n=1 Tax=Haemophilus paracuniculus TaxID=734 RepID=A0A1T0AQ08_9PAST|nr:hypothetical protein [Haemophilus paracuniculus]OOR98158.1 hypothetical protein B0187_09460 [Haemophilus paracuniculus]